jgi:hypothetical protein
LASRHFDLVVAAADDHAPGENRERAQSIAGWQDRSPATAQPVHSEDSGTKGPFPGDQWFESGIGVDSGGACTVADPFKKQIFALALPSRDFESAL